MIREEIKKSHSKITLRHRSPKLRSLFKNQKALISGLFDEVASGEVYLNEVVEDAKALSQVWELYGGSIQSIV